MDSNKIKFSDFTTDDTTLVERATLRMLYSKSDAVFFAYFLIKMRTMYDKHPPHSLGMGVSVADGVFTLSCDVDRMKEHNLYSMELVMFLESHESMHWVFDHYHREIDYWGGDMDKMMQWHPYFNQACDLEVHNNLVVPDELRDKVCICGVGPFKDFPKGLIAEEYFEMIKKNLQNPPEEGQGKPGEGEGEGSERQGKPKEGTGGGPTSQAGRFKVDINGTEVTMTDTKTGKQYKLKVNDSGMPTRDNQEDINRELVKYELGEALKEARPSMGTEPGGLAELVELRIQPAKIDWRHRFKLLVGKHVRSSSRGSWKRYSRRLGEGFRGHIKDHGITLLVAIDTSGSVGVEELQAFCNEIEGLRKVRKVEEVRIIECDAKIGKDYLMKKGAKLSTEFTGRGGTAFEPVFEYVEERKLKFDMLIYLTDSQGSFPKKKPLYPVIWCVTKREDLLPNIPWGDIVLIDEEGKNPEARRT